MAQLTFDRSVGHFLKDGKPITLSPEDYELMTSLNWWHEVPLAPGLSTRAHHSPMKLGLPKLFHIADYDFAGKEVLDIGSADGFYTFWAEAHGAGRVVSLDDLSQLRVGTTKIDFLRRVLGSKAQYHNMSIYDLAPKVLGGFDAVMMFGVLYHLIHPMLGIEKACSVCKSDFFLETHYMQTESDQPMCILYPEREYYDDYTNWSAPNVPWLVGALKTQGFKVIKIEQVSSERVAIQAKRVRNHHTVSDVLNPHRDTTYFHLGEWDD